MKILLTVAATEGCNWVALLLASLCHWKSRALPRIGSAKQCRRVIESLSRQLSRQTGACLFGRSRTVRDNQFVTRQFADTRVQISFQDIYRAFDVLNCVSVWPTSVDYQYRILIKRVF